MVEEEEEEMEVEEEINLLTTPPNIVEFIILQTTHMVVRNVGKYLLNNKDWTKQMD